MQLGVCSCVYSIQCDVVSAVGVSNLRIFEGHSGESTDSLSELSVTVMYSSVSSCPSLRSAVFLLLSCSTALQC